MFISLDSLTAMKPTRQLLMVALLGGCLLSPGCGWNWAKLRGEGFNDEMSKSGQYLRQQDKSDGEPLGTSGKALEIERNLGYR